MLREGEVEGGTDCQKDMGGDGQLAGGVVAEVAFGAFEEGGKGPVVGEGVGEALLKVEEAQDVEVLRYGSIRQTPRQEGRIAAHQERGDWCRGAPQLLAEGDVGPQVGAVGCLGGGGQGLIAKGGHFCIELGGESHFCTCGDRRCRV